MASAPRAPTRQDHVEAMVAAIGPILGLLLFCYSKLGMVNQVDVWTVSCIAAAIGVLKKYVAYGVMVASKRDIERFVLTPMVWILVFYGMVLLVMLSARIGIVLRPG